MTDLLGALKSKLKLQQVVTLHILVLNQKSKFKLQFEK